MQLKKGLTFCQPEAQCLIERVSLNRWATA